MKKYKLGEIADIIVGYPFESAKFNTDGNGVLLVRGMNVSERFLRFGDEARYWNYITDDLKPYYLKENDIVIGMDGSKVGKNFALVKKEDLPLVLVQRVACIRAKRDYDQRYIWQYVSSKRFIEYVNTIKTGSSIPHISGNQISNFPIFVPDLQSQQKISAVLSALDDKIALNRRMNAKLEQMAKRLFDHWFVQFDFPNENGKPYKSSGGKMEYNEVLKHEIPAGWEVKSLGEVCDFPIERFSDKEISEKLYVPIEVIPRYEMSFSETANIEKAASGLCSFSKRSILLSNRRVYFHKVCIAPFEGITRDTVIIINSKDLNNLGFIYQIVNSNHFIDYATLNSYGSEQPVLSTPTVQGYKFVFPNNGIDKIYSKRVDSIINKVLENNLEIRKLTALRNRLLPLLMNGQVEVN